MIASEPLGESTSHGTGVLGCDYWCIGGFSEILAVVDRESRMLSDLFIMRKLNRFSVSIHKNIWFIANPKLFFFYYIIMFEFENKK